MPTKTVKTERKWSDICDCSSARYCKFREPPRVADEEDVIALNKSGMTLMTDHLLFERWYDWYINCEKKCELCTQAHVRGEEECLKKQYKISRVKGSL